MAEGDKKPAQRKRGVRRPPEAAKRSEPEIHAAAPEPSPTAGKATATAKLLALEPISTLFLGCLLVGFLLTLAGLSEVPFLRTIGFWGPILATMAYPVMGMMAGYHQQPQLRERLADNSYYLGFIFTQIALVVGFLPAALTEAKLTSDQVLRYFGLAIGASMIGLVWRTLFVQTGQSLTEYDDQNERQVEALARAVAERSRAVLTQFDQMARDIGEAREQTSRTLSASAGAIAGSISKGAAQIVEAQRSIAAELGQARTAFAADLETGSETNVQLFRSQSEALGRQFEAHAGVAVERSRRMIAEFEAMTQRAIALRQTIDQDVADKMRHILDAVAGHANAMAAETETFRRGAEAVEQATSQVVQRAIVAQSELAAQVETTTVALRQTLGSLPEQLAAVNRSVAATSEALLAGATAFEAFKQLAPTVDALGAQVTAVTAKVDEATQTLDAGARSMQGAVNDVRAGADSQAQALKQDLDGSVLALKETLDNFRTALGQIRV